MRESLNISGHEIKAGENKTIDLPVSELYTHTSINMPVHVLHSKKDGPILFVSAAIHGDEINGVEIIRRLLKMKALNKLRGTLIAIPIVNVFGFLNHSRYSPDRRDLNRFFPGNESGSLTSWLAYLFMEEIVSKCTHGIDIHTGSNHRVNLPQIRAYLDDPETERLALTFGTPVILDADLLEGSLRQAVKERNIPILVYESGEVLRFDEAAIKLGVRGVLSVMRAIGMLPKVRRKTDIQPVISDSSTWVRAPSSGIIKTKIKLGDRVSENSRIGIITDPFGERESEIISTASGIVIGSLKLPLVHRGDALFHVARFGSTKAAVDSVTAFRQEFEPEV